MDAGSWATKQACGKGLSGVQQPCSDSVAVRRCFQEGCLKGQDADAFVEDMKKAGIRVPGIGHRIKSKARSAQSCGLLRALHNPPSWQLDTC